MVKTVAGLLGLLRAVPHLICHGLAKPVLGKERAFMGASEKIARIGGHLGVYTRQAFYRIVLNQVGADVYFGFMSVFSKTGAKIGQRVYIGRFCTIGLADIGDDVMLADGVQVLSGGRQHGTPESSAEGKTLQDNEQQFTLVTIGAGAWIGAGAVVMADIGQGAIVGAGAVVTRPVSAGATVGGVPARLLGGQKADTA